MKNSKGLTITIWILSVILAILFLLAGSSKFMDSAGWIEKFAAWGYPEWFLTVIMVLEISGAIGILIPRTSFWAASLLGVIMIGALFTHLMAGQTAEIIRPLVFLVILGTVIWFRCPRTEKKMTPV